MLEDRVDRVARRAGRFRHDRALLVQERVDERGFADVGPSDDGQSDFLGRYGGRVGGQVLIGFLSALAGRGQPRPDRLLQVVDPLVVLGGDSVDLRKAELERLALPFPSLLAIDLVRHDDGVAAGLADDPRRGPVARQHAGRGVQDEQHEIRAADRRHSLIADGPGHSRLVLGIEASGVQDREGSAVGKATFGLENVAGHAGQVVHERPAPAHETVEHGGLSDVGPSCDDDPEGLHFFAGALRMPPTSRSV